MLVINLFGAPGVSKSTGAANVFSRLKMSGINCEYVNEYPKELVWEKRAETFKDEIYLFAKQNHRMLMVKDKVDIVITDRPLLLTKVYNHYNGFDSDELDALADAEFAKYANINFLVTRAKPFNPAGRLQTLEESEVIQAMIEGMLREVPGKHVFKKVPGNMEGFNKIYFAAIYALDEHIVPKASE